MSSLIPLDISFNNNTILVDKDENDSKNKDILYQNGEYKTVASSSISTINSPFKAFDNKPDTYWQCDTSSNKTAVIKYSQDPYNGYLPSSYVGGGTDKTNFITFADKKQYLGEWIQINLPYSTYLVEYKILSKNFPRKFHLFGSNDGSSWSLMDSKTINTDYSNSASSISFKVKSILKFNHFRLVISQLFSGTVASINQFELFGSQDVLSNLKSLETFSNCNDCNHYNSSYNTKITSQYYSNTLQYNSMAYKPFSKFDVIDTNNIIENFTSLREPLELQDVNVAINDFNDKSNIANKNYGNLVTGINNYLINRNELINTSLYDYSGNILFINNGKPTMKDGLESDTKEFVMQENNILILGSISLAFLLIGTYVILRN